MTTKYVALAMIILGVLLIWRGVRGIGASFESGRINLVVGMIFAGAVLVWGGIGTLIVLGFLAL